MDNLFNNLKCHKNNIEWYFDQIKEEIDQKREYQRYRREEKEKDQEQKKDQKENEKEKSDLFEKLKNIDFDKNYVIVETKTMHDRRILRVYANKYELRYRNICYDDFETTIQMFKCKNCNKRMRNEDLSWQLDMSSITPGLIFGNIGTCTGCWENKFFTEYGIDDEDNQENFRIWDRNNSVIIGKSLGEYEEEETTITISSVELRKAMGDKRWNERLLKDEMDKINYNIVIKQ